MAEKNIIESSKLINLINELNLYIKFVEQRVIRAEMEIKSLREFLNNIDRKLTKFQEEYNRDLNDLKNKITNLELEIDKLKSDLNKKADITEAKKLRELIELFNPLQQPFATKEEVKRMIEEAININRDKK